jgi:hypothetical protein
MSDAFDPFDGESKASADGDVMNATFDTTHTFESPDFFEFSALSHNDDNDNNMQNNNPLQAPLLFPDDPMFPTLQDNSNTNNSNNNSNSNISTVAEPNTIHVALHEQLTTLHQGNGNGSAPISQVEGSIHVRSSTASPFSLLIRDENRHIESFHADPKFSMQGNQNDADSFLGDRDKLLRLTLPINSAKKKKVASYTCSAHLRPIPLLVKSKVLVEEDRCRVGVKIRSNPANQRPLTQIAILMAVPPDIRGETVKLTRQGGVWDGMKRVVAWPAETLEPGELIEIQAQFNFVSNQDPDRRSEPKFPLLVRCEGTNDQFSDIELITDIPGESYFPVKMRLTRSLLILHRKV